MIIIVIYFKRCYRERLKVNKTYQTYHWNYPQFRTLQTFKESYDYTRCAKKAMKLFKYRSYFFNLWTALHRFQGDVDLWKSSSTCPMIHSFEYYLKSWYDVLGGHSSVEEKRKVVGMPLEVNGALWWWVIHFSANDPFLSLSSMHL